MGLTKLAMKCKMCGKDPCECKEEDREVKDFKEIKDVVNRELKDHQKYVMKDAKK